MKSSSILCVAVLTIALVCLSPQTSYAQTKYSLKKNQIQDVGSKQLCGLIKSKWTPVKKSGKKYVVDSKNKSRCKVLLAPTSLKKGGIASIPSPSLMLKASTALTRQEVSGTPPLLKDIPVLGAKNVFWSPGFIDTLLSTSTPTQAQCQEFFHGLTDGQSAGVLGCYATQGVGFSFQSILDGSTSACLMKGLPTRENLSGGAISIVEGSLPDEDITKIFSPPSGTQDRVIKINIGQGVPGGGPTPGPGSGPPPGGGGPSPGGGNQGGRKAGFIKIRSERKLASQGLQYAYNLWFCEDGQTTPNNYEETTVSLAGDYKLRRVHLQGPQSFQNEISAFLTKTGSVISFDLSRERSARSVGEFQGGKFQSFVKILSDNTITTKVKESFNDFARSNYAIASFTGGGLSEFRVRSAAVKDGFRGRTRQTGIEYREPTYTSAPTIALVAQLSSVELGTDPFFADDSAVTPDFTDKPCTGAVDVTLSMDFSNPLLRGVFMSCEDDRLQNMDFCRSNELFQAQSKCIQ